MKNLARPLEVKDIEGKCIHMYMYAYVGRAVTTKACLMAIITDFSQPQRKRQQRHPFWPAAGRLMAGE